LWFNRGAGAASGRAIDLRQYPQLVSPGERPTARPIRHGNRRRWGCHGGRPPASHRVSPSGAIQLPVSDWHNHVISVLRPEAKLFGLRCLMIIGTEVASTHGTRSARHILHRQCGLQYGVIKTETL
jgi:hypothetical protein